MQGSTSNYSDYFDLLNRLLHIGGEEIASYFLHAKLVGRMFEFLYEPKSKKKNAANNKTTHSEFDPLGYYIPPIALLGLPS